MMRHRHKRGATSQIIGVLPGGSKMRQVRGTPELRHLLHALNRRILTHGHAHGGSFPQRGLPCAWRVRAQDPAAGVQPAEWITAHIIQLTAACPEAPTSAHTLHAGDAQQSARRSGTGLRVAPVARSTAVRRPT